MDDKLNVHVETGKENKGEAGTDTESRVMLNLSVK